MAQGVSGAPAARPHASVRDVDVLVVGAGPAGIFCALGLLAHGGTRHVTLVERGLPVERRRCPKASGGRCAH